jgi:hypothetical protein
MIHVDISIQSPNLTTESRRRVLTLLLSLRKILVSILAQSLVLFLNPSSQILRQYLN